MAPIATEESTGIDAGGRDPFRRAAHVALAIYLLPVFAIVYAIGGASIVINRASRLASRLATDGRRGARPRPLPVVRSGEAEWSPSAYQGRRRTRVEH